jgi:hypothetical protein
MCRDGRRHEEAVVLVNPFDEFGQLIDRLATMFPLDITPKEPIEDPDRVEVRLGKSRPG